MLNRWVCLKCLLVLSALLVDSRVVWAGLLNSRDDQLVVFGRMRLALGGDPLKFDIPSLKEAKNTPGYQGDFVEKNEWGGHIGDGLEPELGVLWNPTHSGIALELVQGARTNAFSGSSLTLNGSYTNVVPMLRFGNHYIGAGFSYHHGLVAKYGTGADNLNESTVDEVLGPVPEINEIGFKSSLGTVVQYVYGDQSVRYGVRATFIDYRVDKVKIYDPSSDQFYNRRHSQTFSGNSISVFLQVGFGVL